MRPCSALPLLVGLMSWATGGCERAPTQGVTATQPQPARADSARRQAPRSEEATRPASPSSSRPATNAAQPEPKVPRYLKILGRFDERAGASVRARLEPPAKLDIQTDNVSRLRILRDALPLERQRSTILRIDGQVFEWTQRSDVVELARSRNGVWSAVKPGKPGP